MFSKGHQQPPAGYKEDAQTQVKGRDVRGLFSLSPMSSSRSLRGLDRESGVLVVKSHLIFKKENPWEWEKAGVLDETRTTTWREGMLSVRLEVGNSQLEG